MLSLGVFPGLRTTARRPGTALLSRSLSSESDAVITKVLAANRGEIAIRIMRATSELQKSSAGIYSSEDRYSVHRYKADESYLVGEGLNPVAAYLEYNGIIALAKSVGVDGIHPGYGFLSENADFADACADAGIKFIGPPGDVLRRFGSKTEARALAIEAGVPVVPGSDGPVRSVDDALAFAESAGLPVIIKAAFGGGGRGMRIVREMSEVAEAFERAKSEAHSAFGNDTVFMEKFVERPRHIEVQILADQYGNVVHLFERDCSVQRRHQKVVEYAPALSLPEESRTAMLNDAIKLAKAVNYQNAGTVEFLVDTSDGKHYFMEVNPRVQVEHTVTEEVTGVDIVQSQIRIAEGASLKDLGLSQDTIKTNGFAVQCRITTEDPTQNFQPDTGVISVYRAGSGYGIRLDEGPGYPGAVITPHYDSLLVKVTARDKTFKGATAKLTRALNEHRIRGVTTNIPFLRNVVKHDLFQTGRVTTRFIEENPDLITDVEVSQNRGEKLLKYLAEVAVNGVPAELGASPGVLPGPVDPIVPDISTLKGTKPSLRQVFVEGGPEAFAKAVRDHKGLLLTDTTWRDAHQSLLATRMRTVDMLNIAAPTRHVLGGLFSIENWGGATFDVCMRFLRECPWERLEAMREAIPDVPFQMLLRGANAVGYTSYPDNAVHKFCDVAVQKGMDVFRVFDSLNYIENMRLGIDAVRGAGGIAEAAICYSGDLTNPARTKYTLDYYLEFARQLVDAGANVLAIKDMAGLLKPEAATILVSALRAEFPHIPIHVHTHDTPGTGVASMLAAAKAGADAVDVAIDGMSGTTSQPSMGAVVGAVAGSDLDTGFDAHSVSALNDYWEACRGLYKPFESGQHTGSADTYEHEMPGGQYTNLLFQSTQLGLAGRWPAIKKAYGAANRILGDIVKVTPSSKVVGDLAQFMVSNDLSEQDVLDQASSLSFPSSVVEYLQGYLGVPVGGFPEPFRSDVLKDRRLPSGKISFDGRPGAEMEPLDFESIRSDLQRDFGKSDDASVMSHVMYPAVYKEWQQFRQMYGSVSSLPTRVFLAPVEVGSEVALDVAPGKRLYIKLRNIGALDQTGSRDVDFTMNGEPRTVRVEDKKADMAGSTLTRPKADKSNPGHIGSPMMGVVVDVRVKPGDKVKVGDPLVTMSAMKMETVVSASAAGTVSEVFVGDKDAVLQGDLLVSVE